MSKEVEWSPFYGEGDIVCTCEQCGCAERFPFDDNHPDYAEAQHELMKLGWVSLKIDGKWHDFCCESHRNKFIKSNT